MIFVRFEMRDAGYEVHLRTRIPDLASCHLFVVSKVRLCYNSRMRVTGGEFRGRKLMVPTGDKVRPTQDRVREALFSILMNVIPGAVFIDLFAGSGAVGLDAYSRGAGSVTWVESSLKHVRVLRKKCFNTDAGPRRNCHSGC